MRLRSSVPAALACLLLACPALGLVEPAVAPRPSLQPRPAAEPGLVPATSGAARALAALEERTGGALRAWSDPLTGAPRALFGGGAPLSDPLAGRPEVIARAFLKANRELWRADEADLATLELVRVFESPLLGLTHVSLRQRVGGIVLYAGETRVHLDALGQVVAVTSDLVPGIAVAGEPALDGAAAVLLAAADVGRSPATLPPLATVPGPEPAAGAWRFADALDPMGFGLRLEAVIFPAPGGPRLAWEVGIGNRDGVPAWYDVVIDAVTGQVLSRLNRAAYAGGLAFPLASPPMTGAGCPATGPQQAQSFGPTAESPDGFVDPTLAGSYGNNLRAQEDRANLDFGAVAPPSGTGRWDYAFQDSYARTGDPLPDLNAAITNLFATGNLVHDHLLARGFDEASGNFQRLNFGRGGEPGDPLWADAQDGSGSSNANFATDVDGLSPRMQMYLWPGSRRDGDFDNTVIAHEYGHGLSHRLVGVNCLNGVEAGAMGEGWSDFLACSMYDTPLVAAYVTQNCVRGIRRASYAPGSFPFTYRDVCGNGCQVHNDGEIWAAALWRMRESIAREVGSRELAACIAETLVVGGMKLTPCNPTMLQARDALLAAAREKHPELLCLVWAAFADRGLGYSATSTGGSVPGSRREAMDLPAECGRCQSRPPAPMVTADTSTPNQVLLSWSPVPGATQYTIHLSGDGACGRGCSPAGERILATVAATSWRDLGLPGGVPRTYRVRAHTSGLCVSDAACAVAVPGGSCGLVPAYDVDQPGVQAVEAPGQGSPCGLVVRWSPARSRCPGADIVYNIYRDTSPVFTPSAANRIASVSAPAGEYADDAGLTSGVTYYYRVRAEDTTSGGSGPHGGNEEGNTRVAANTPHGPAIGTDGWIDTLAPQPRPGWTHGSWPSQVPDNWAVVTDANTGGVPAWHAAAITARAFGLSAAIQDLVLPPVSLGPGAVFSFDHKIQVEDQWDGGVLEISTDGGNSWHDLGPSMVRGGYNGITVSMMTFRAPPYSNQLWSGTLPVGFSGWSPVSVDLSDFAGARDARLRFRALWDYDTPAGMYGGWYISNLRLSNHSVFDSCSPPAGCTVRADAQALGTTRLCPGGTVSLSAAASSLSGCPSGPAYQWLENGQPIAGASAPVYELPATLAPGTWRYEAEVSCAAQPTCRARSAPVMVTVEPEPLRAPGLRGLQRGIDAVFSWDVEPTATGGYRLYATADRWQAGVARGGVNGAILIGTTSADPAATTLTHAGAFAPGVEPQLYYQAVSLCIDGATEGPN